ncbi:MAG TPA: M56 family metallopeptidase [Candidatus Polarisedimenticolia bacterium]|nr:M56 family metallopeptidase [Candidatus Polarisedimenticolia bacterium]
MIVGQMVMADQWQVVAQIFADRMLNSILGGTVVAAFAWILLRALARQSSGTRFAVRFSAMVAVAALPFVGNIGFGGAGTLASSPHSALRLPGSWAIDIFGIWAVFASVGLAKVAFSFWQLRRLRYDCTVLEPCGLHPLLRNTLSQFGSSRRVAIVTSDRVRVPAALGLVKPAIVLPGWALRELSPVELNAVLLHELAHLRRWDDWTNLAQEILKALFFFHPAFWWVGHGLSLEREMACDDFVLARTSSPQAYAQCLVSVAEKSFLRRGLALAQAVAGRIEQTSQRLIRILDVDRPTATKVSKPALGLVAAFSAICVMSLPHAPRLVAFEAGPGFSASDRAGFPEAGIDSSAVGAKLIPAALQIPGASPSSGRNSNSAFGKTIRVKAPPDRAVKQKSPNVSRHVAMRSDNADANFVTLQVNSPRLVNGNANEASFVQEVRHPQSMLLVIQTAEVDGYGRVWSIRIVQFTVFHPVDRRVQREITPKST